MAYLNLTLPTYRWSEQELATLAWPPRAAAAELESRLGVRSAATG